MRPLELTIEGFKSYRDKAQFSFDGRSLFGIVGPTGAGKSSILDALIYCLYGKTPRLESGTRRLINTGSDLARVELVFEARGEPWEVTRALRDKGQSQVVLRRVDDDSVPVVSGASMVNDAIEELIGLDFNAFLSTVTLPQGEFARFLNAAGSERSKILKGIFRLDRVDKIREIAKARQGEVDGKLSALNYQAASLPEDPEAQIIAQQAELQQAEALQEEVKIALPSVLKLEAEAERSEEELARLAGRIDEVTVLITEIPSPDVLQERSDMAESAAEEFAAAEKALVLATERLAAATAAFAEAEASTGGEGWIQQLTMASADLVRVTEALGGLEEEAKQVAAQRSLAEAEQSAAAAVVEQATAAVSEAQASLQELHRAHAADLLRKDLKPGDPCPVCEQKVAGVPKVGKTTDVDKAEQTLVRARQQETTARGVLTKADVAQGVANDRMQGIAAKMEEAASALVDVTTRISEMVPIGTDAAAELARRKELLSSSAHALTEARAFRDEVEQRERGSRKTRDEVVKGLDTAVRALMRVCGALKVPFTGTEPFGQLPGIAKRAHESALGEIDALRQKSSDLVQAKRESSSAIDEFRRRFNAAEGESASDVVARVSQRVVSIQHTITGLKESIARRQEVEKRITGLTAQKALIERVTTDFTDSRFTKFLLDGQRRLLSRIGSEKLMELTGHYRFDDDGEFNIIDTRSGTTRHPDTLSGGETFLASLALALALAEAVALEGGQLGCFFLDEGFGSLDAESLDLALEGIESLATPGRVIGLISHVFSIQSTLDDLIVLEKDSEGATIVVQDGGPIGYMAPMI